MPIFGPFFGQQNTSIVFKIDFLFHIFIKLSMLTALGEKFKQII